MRVADAASGGEAALDHVADLVGCVRVRTIEDRIHLDLLCRGGVAGQLTHQGHAGGALGSATAETITGVGQNGRQRDSVCHCGSFLGGEVYMIESPRDLSLIHISEPTRPY